MSAAAADILTDQQISDLKDAFVKVDNFFSYLFILKMVIFFY